MEAMENRQPLPRRARVVLRALKELGVRHGMIRRVLWNKLADATGYSSGDLVYGLGTLLLQGRIRYRLILTNPAILYVSMRGKNATESLRTYVYGYKKLPGVRKRTFEQDDVWARRYQAMKQVQPPARSENTGPTVENSSSERGLARKLAKILNEEDRLDYYEKLVSMYSVELIHKALAACQKIPDERIRKNRAALFKSLLNHYANNSAQKLAG